MHLKKQCKQSETGREIRVFPPSHNISNHSLLCKSFYNSSLFCYKFLLLSAPLLAQQNRAFSVLLRLKNFVLLLHAHFDRLGHVDVRHNPVLDTCGWRKGGSKSQQQRAEEISGKKQVTGGLPGQRGTLPDHGQLQGRTPLPLFLTL